MKGLLHKKLTKKGFTLAELLIVVAILAILVAVSIPIFTSQLNKAKKSTDMANVRAFKALVTQAIISEEYPVDDWIITSEIATTYYDAKNGSLSKAHNIEGYGQGSDTLGETNGIGYWKDYADSSEAIKDSILAAMVDTSSGTYSIMWIPS